MKQYGSLSTTGIEFIPDTHTYLYYGVVIPSVSEIVRYRFPEAYKNIPEKILKKKASYGTKVHELIESFLKGEITMEEIQAKRIDPNIKIAVEQFEYLRKEWCFYIKDMERIVTYDGMYAGMFDLLTEDNKVIDIKTTTDLHMDWLALQLGLYQLGLDLNNETAYCMWLPKGKAGKVVEVKPLTKVECIKILCEYHNV